MSKLSEKEFNKLFKEMKSFCYGIECLDDQVFVLNTLRRVYYQLYLDMNKRNEARENAKESIEFPF